MSVITEITESENFNSSCFVLFFSFLQYKDKEVKCKLWGKSCAMWNRDFPLRRWLVWWVYISVQYGWFTFNLKSNLGFIFSQRFSIYNHSRGCNGIGSLEFQSFHHFPITKGVNSCFHDCQLYFLSTAIHWATTKC